MLMRSYARITTTNITREDIRCDIMRVFSPNKGLLSTDANERTNERVSDYCWDIARGAMALNHRLHRKLICLAIIETPSVVLATNSGGPIVMPFLGVTRVNMLSF